MSVQTPHAVVMIRPHHFSVNLETLSDNAFQNLNSGLTANKIAVQAYAEVSQAIKQLRAHGVTVHVFDDLGEHDTPDSVFPNNWFSTHHDGSIYLYPMLCHNRRREVRQDILDFLAQHYQVKQSIDLRHYENQQQFLEGTGAIVFDHQQRYAYMCLSQRASPHVLQDLCRSLGFQPQIINATMDHKAIYHTNVMLSIGRNFALVGLETIQDEQQRSALLRQLCDASKDVIELSSAQIRSFAANALELQSSHGTLLALSTTALASLHADQRQRLEKHTRLLPLEVPTIELAGGSVRCMLAGIHLPKKSK
jgi:hypothetical protein